jgi:hypothetical protein
LPDAPIIACVRHPLDTIASWKTSFTHLKQADVAHFPVGAAHDPLLSQWQHYYLQEIVETPHEALKRALLWRYLAECLLRFRRQLLLICYEDLVCQPQTVIPTLLRQILSNSSVCYTVKIDASTIRQKRQVLDNEDIQAINDICHQHALELGYNL